MLDIQINKATEKSSREDIQVVRTEQWQPGTIVSVVQNPLRGFIYVVASLQQSLLKADISAQALNP